MQFSHKIIKPFLGLLYLKCRKVNVLLAKWVVAHIFSANRIKMEEKIKCKKETRSIYLGCLCNLLVINLKVNHCHANAFNSPGFKSTD